MALDTVQITSRILEYVPREAGITRIEYEGPSIAIYSKDPSVLLYHGYVLTEIANKLKKRVIARSEPSERTQTDEARDRIGEVMKPHTKVPGMYFDPVKGEVTLYLEETLDPTLFPELSVRIVSKTKWFPIFKKHFEPFSKTLIGIYSANSYYERERRKFLLNLGDRIFRQPLNPSRDISITILGGSQEVGRSAALVSTSETKLLVDFGLKPGVNDRMNAYPRIDVGDFNIDELDGVIITHAHLDHSGMVPFLYKHGYNGPLYMTEPTLPLSVLLQLDLIQVAQRNGEVPPYNPSDVRKMIYHTVQLKYGQVTDISPDVKLTLYNAGHVLGSAISHLHIVEGVHNIVFTGDFKYGPTLLLDSAYSNFMRAETVVMESTYGGDEDITPQRAEAEATLLETINRILEKGGKVLMPTLAVGRAQEILVHLEKFLREKKMMEVPIYIDGMIDESTAIHVSFPEYLSSKLKKMILDQGLNPFSSEHFVIVDDPSLRTEALQEGSCIIVATSGMLEGGPVLEYLKHVACDERNMILFTSYQVSGTLGRRILNGTKNIIMSRGDKMQTINIMAETRRIEGFSGHSDRKQLQAYLKKLSPMMKNLFLVHGEPEKSLALAKATKKLIHGNVWPLKNLQTVPLAK